MDKKLIGLLVAAAIGLSACGSTGAARDGKAEGHALGESSSQNAGNNTSSNNNNTASTTTTTTTTPTDTNPPQTERLGLGVVYGSVSKEHKDRSTYFATNDTKWELDTIDEVVIDGRRIALVPQGQSATNGIYESPAEGEKIYTGTSTAPFAQDKTKSWRKISTDLKHARYGEIHDEYEKRHIVVTGNLTPTDKMPTANEEVVYKGKALHTKDSYTAARDGLRPVSAEAEFRVNFHQHTLAGVVKPVAGATGENNFAPVTLKATIEGNSFQGNDTADVVENYTILTMDGDEKRLVKTPAHVTGYFYGPNGEEMAGAYNKITGENEVVARDGSLMYPRNTLHGTFGATKQ